MGNYIKLERSETHKGNILKIESISKLGEVKEYKQSASWFDKLLGMGDISYAYFCITLDGTELEIEYEHISDALKEHGFILSTMLDTQKVLSKLSNIENPHVAYQDHSLRDLFVSLRNAADLYIHDIDNEWADMDTKPHAMLYKAAVLQQDIDEIKARAKVLLGGEQWTIEF